MADATPPSLSVPQEVAALRQQVAHLEAALTAQQHDAQILHKAMGTAEHIVETVREPLLVLTADFRVQSANPAFYQMFQVHPIETIGQPLYHLGDGQWDIPALHTLLEHILPQDTVFNDYEVTHNFARIGPRTILLNARRLDHVDLILLAMEDITVRRRDETAEHQQREVLAVTLGSIGDAVLTTDTAGRITFLNPVAEALTGWSLQDALGQPCEVVFRLVHEQTRQPLESPVARVLREGIVLDLAPQTVLLTRDGREVPVADLSAPIRRGAEQPYGVVVVFRDGSDLRRLEEQLRQAQKMEALGILARGIAHDFNNIVMAVIGYTELVQDTVALTSPAARWLQQVITASLRAKALVQQIFAFSHRTPLEYTPVSLAIVLRETLEVLRVLLPATIVLEMHITPEASMVLGDAAQLSQIVLNLGTNAAYAMRDTVGRLEIRLEAIDMDALLAAAHPALRPGPYVRLTMCDTGSGIPPDMLARVYEPFFTTKEVGQGQGLGLSVVHGIVESHGGSILIESSLGQGTTVVIYLPRLVAPAAGAASPASEQLSRSEASADSAI